MKSLIFLLLTLGLAQSASAFFNFCSQKTTDEVRSVLESDPMTVLQLGKREFGLYSKANKQRVKELCGERSAAFTYFTGKVIAGRVCGQLAWTCQIRNIEIEGGDGDDKGFVGVPDSVDPGTGGDGADPGAGGNTGGDGADPGAGGNTGGDGAFGG